MKILNKFSFIFCFVLLFSFTNTYANEKSIGTVRAVINKVSIIKEKGTEKKANVGDPVYLKDTIDTHKNGKIKILFDNENILVLGFKSKLVINELVYDPNTNKSQSVFTLIKGKVRSIVKKLLTPNSHFKIKTANSDIGVLGTDFIVIYNDTTDELRAFVESGQITISDPKNVWKEVRLLDSYYTTIKGASPTEPSKFTKETYSPIKNELTVYEDVSLNQQSEFEEYITTPITPTEILQESGEPSGDETDSKASEPDISDIELEAGDPSELVLPPIDQEPQTGSVRVKVTTPFP